MCARVTGMRDMIRKLLHEVDEAIFPSGIYCVCCGALIDRSRMYSLCDDCIPRFHWITGRTCEKCGKAMPDTSRGRLCYDCMQEEHFFTKGFSCLTYGLHERELMMDLKYAGKGYLARIFGDVMFDRMELEIREGLFAPGCGGGAGQELQQGESFDGRTPGVRIDIIAPVPVSQGRLRKRGYNQSAIMARQLARRWKEYVRENQAEPMYPAPVCRTDLLCRTRETQMLRSLNPTERRMVLQNVFAVSEHFRGKLTGRTVLLIDDIYTTGATADACSQALLEGGAAEVYLLTLASGGNRKPEIMPDDECESKKA